MTDLRKLFGGPVSASTPPGMDELRVGDRRHRRLASLAVPVMVVIAAGVGVLLFIGTRDGSRAISATGGLSTAAGQERAWVIPTFLDEPLEAFEIFVETYDSPEVTELELTDDPNLAILVFRDKVGVFEDSGSPVDANGIAAYLRVEPVGSVSVVDIEWRADGLWQVFQTVAVSEAVAIDMARSFQADGLDALTALGWHERERQDAQQTTTIVGPSGVLLFQNEPADLVGAITVGESNDITVYTINPADSQLFFAYQGRIVFSYKPPDYYTAISPSALADSLDIVSEQRWQAWLDTWTVVGS